MLSFVFFLVGFALFGVSKFKPTKIQPLVPPVFHAQFGFTVLSSLDFVVFSVGMQVTAIIGFVAIVAGLIVVVRSSSLAKVRTLRFSGPSSSGAAAAADISRADRVRSMNIEHTQPEGLAKQAGSVQSKLGPVCCVCCQRVRGGLGAVETAVAREARLATVAVHAVSDFDRVKMQLSEFSGRSLFFGGFAYFAVRRVFLQHDAPHVLPCSRATFVFVLFFLRNAAGEFPVHTAAACVGCVLGLHGPLVFHGLCWHYVVHVRHCLGRNSGWTSATESVCRRHSHPVNHRYTDSARCGCVPRG
jgi:hypothetical protein